MWLLLNRSTNFQWRVKMSRSFRALGSIAAVTLVNAGLPGVLSSTSTASAVTLTSVVVRSIDRSGVASQLKGFFRPVAARFLRNGYEEPYYATLNGVLRLPSGTYLIGMDIPTYGPGDVQVSDTLAARVLRIGTSGGTRTITVDARLGRAVRVSLTLPGASQQFAEATLCASTSAYKGRWGLDLAAGGHSGKLYAVPSQASNLRFIMGSVWQGADGSQYGLGASTPGIPRHPDFSYAPSDLATLRFRVASGTTPGVSGSLDEWFSGPCQAGGPGVAQIAKPGQAIEHVSAGRWDTQLTVRGPSDYGLQVVQDAAAGHAYTATFGSAVYGPGIYALPRFASGRFGFLSVGLEDLFQDPASNSGRFPSDGILRLAAGRQIIRTYRFSPGTLFTAELRNPGWYTIRLTARPVPPPQGVAPATLSTKVGLTWRFAETAHDLATLGPVPVSVTTFRPQGLSLRNQAALSSVTPIRLVIRRGQPDRAHQIKTVQLEVSRDGGVSWHAVRVTGQAGGWLAKVPNPFSGFVSLRSIVTDVRGDRTVETVYRAYEVI